MKNNFHRVEDKKMPTTYKTFEYYLNLGQTFSEIWKVFTAIPHLYAYERIAHFAQC